MQILTMFRGNTKKLDAALTLGGVAIDLTTKSLYFTVKLDPTSTSNLFQKSIGAGITLTNAVGGLAQIVIDPADTTGLASNQKRLWFDLEYVSGTEIYTVADGRLVVNPDITVR
jgi:hypothetical protein